MTKESHTEIMKRSRLRNNFLRTKSQEDRLKYDKQRKFCKKLLRTAKTLYVKLFVTISLILSLNFKFQVYPKIFQM